MRQTIIERKIAGQHLDVDALVIADRGGRILAVIDFDPNFAPHSSTPTRQ